VEPGQLWTLDEVAAYLRVSPTTIRRWTNAGKLPCYRLGTKGERRFSAEKVALFLAEHEQKVKKS
jgi:excisionase family DNA binding protein